MLDNSCPLCNVKLNQRITHQHGREHFRSPANLNGGQPGIWHDVRWSRYYQRWVCDSRCRGGYGKECRHIKEVLDILRDEFEAWLGEVPHRQSVTASAKRIVRLEDLYE